LYQQFIIILIQTKGHVTFANRIVSAVVDNNEAYNKNIGHRYTSVGGQNETRPNTTQTFRVT
jgi:hypothetical protein